MVDRTLLTARDWYYQTNDLLDVDLSEEAMQSIETAFSALRFLLDFPTDQQVRVAMEAERNVADRIVNGESGEGEYEQVEAGLLAVRNTIVNG